jgi:RND superfamily putative drug exporter
LPLKAILMNLLSVGATFGILVLVFQKGFGSSVLGVEGPADIQNFIPILLLALLFSLSTDYEVFLLGRVREEFVKTGDNTQSVARGVASTAPLISGAALLMVVVFGGFAFAGILPMKQLGFGMAVAIAIDATIVRLVIVPASMRLLGRWNWWMPGRGIPGPKDAEPLAAPVVPVAPEPVADAYPWRSRSPSPRRSACRWRPRSPSARSPRRTCPPNGSWRSPSCGPSRAGDRSLLLRNHLVRREVAPMTATFLRVRAPTHA